jgi:hypothetical protein
MKTDLPAPDEYYRLTRARELRRKAARWTYRLHVAAAVMGATCLAGAVLVSPQTSQFLTLVTSGVPLQVLETGFAWERPFRELVVAAVVVLLSPFLAMGFLAGLAGVLLQRPRCFLWEADRLEAEHRVRYGALSVGEEP